MASFSTRLQIVTGSKHALNPGDSICFKVKYNPYQNGILRDVVKKKNGRICLTIELPDRTILKVNDDNITYLEPINVAFYDGKRATHVKEYIDSIDEEHSGIVRRSIEYDMAQINIDLSNAIATKDPAIQTETFIEQWLLDNIHGSKYVTDIDDDRDETSLNYRVATTAEGRDIDIEQIPYIKGIVDDINEQPLAVTKEIESKADKVDDMDITPRIYTSYFANMNKILAKNPNTVFVSISKSIPSSVHGELREKLISYDPLSPSWSILNEYKSNNDEIAARTQYVQRFTTEVLNKLEPKSVMNILTDYSVSHNHADVVLLCWEGPNKFCHRSIVAKWLNAYDQTIHEYDQRIHVTEWSWQGK